MGLNVSELNINSELLQKTKDKIQSYWNRPGGKLGTILGVGLLAFVGYKIWENVVPKVIQMLDDTTELAWGISKATVAMGVTAFLVGGLLYAVSNKRFRAGITLLWEKIFINSWLSVFIKTDPKLIAKGKIDDFAESRQKFDEKSQSISGDLEGVNKQISEIDETIRRADRKIAVANKLEEADVLVQEKELALEWKNKLIPLKTGLEYALKRCDDIYEYSGYALQKMKIKFDYTCKMYDSTRKFSSALKGALAMISGGSAKSQLGDEAMFFMESEISQNLGSLKQDLKKLDTYTNSYDLEKRVYRADALEEIKQLNPGLYQKMQLDLNTSNIPQAQVISSTPGNNSHDNLLKF